METRMEEKILQEINTLNNKRHALNLCIILTGSIDCACCILSFKLPKVNQIMILIILIAISYMIISNAYETIELINSIITKYEHQIQEICRK